MNNKFVATKLSAELKLSDDGAKSSIVSIILHLTVAILIIVGLPHKKNLPESHEIVVEIMQIKEKTHLAAKRTEENTKEPVKEVKTSDLPQPIIEEVKKEEPQEVPKPEEIKPPVPELPKPEEIKLPELKKEQVKPPELKKEAPKPKKEVKKEKPKKDINKDKTQKKKPKNNFDSLLKSLEKSVSNKKVDNKSTNYSKKLDEELHKDLSVSLQNDIKRQLHSCWSPPAGAKDLKDLAVVVRIELDRNGGVISAEQIEAGVMGGSYYNSAINAAIRAVWKCSPLQNLPKENYEAWKIIEFNFDPSDIVY